MYLRKGNSVHGNLETFFCKNLDCILPLTNHTQVNFL